MGIIQVTRQSGIPLIGHIAFGIIVRGSSNLIQVRPTTICNLNCPFCSTDGGPFSKTHKNQYIVDPSYLIDGIKDMAKIKGQLHVNIDSVGEPTTYPYLTDFISKLREIKEVAFISMQTNGTLLAKEKIRDLEKAGLNRINLSIHTMSDDLARVLAGTQSYSIKEIMETAKAINESGIELLIAPVYLPSINDKEMEEVIKFAKGLGCKIALQKYEEYRYSRKVRGAKKQNFYRFYRQLKAWEKEFNIRLIYNAKSLQVERAPPLRQVVEKGERINTRILAEGWMNGQKIAGHKNRCITINSCKASVNDNVNIRIIENKNNIYLAEMA